MKVLALVLTAVMFGAIACESAPDTIVGVVAECKRSAGFDENRRLVYEEAKGSSCFNSSADLWSGKERRWTITVKTPQGTTYTAEVDHSLRPQLGDTWP